MRRVFKLTLMTALLATLLVSPALAKKAPIERTVVDGVTIAQVKPNTQLPPYYPATARTSKPHAEVVLAVEVDEKGKVSGVQVVNESVEGLGFGESAADAVKAWRFLPAIEEGTAISSVAAIRLTFAPPTLRTPEGFVFTEAATRFYSARHFDTMFAGGRDLNQSIAFIEQIRDSFASHEPPREAFGVSVVPCQPTRGNGPRCVYDRRELPQFSGTVHHTPVPEIQ